eukprot:GHVN01101466.1.p1 GENE.GHVN01101466.1~~GHVN01101466.1.p1  ORF type:complete len:457 (+),score=97.66 GHVN01101466.1:99-1373(+)
MGVSEIVKVPIQLMGNPQPDMLTVPTAALLPILPAQVASLTETPESRSFVPFNYKSKCWQGGSCESQMSLLPSRSLWSIGSVDIRRPLLPLEGYSNLWASASELRKFGGAEVIRSLLGGSGSLYSTHSTQQSLALMAEAALTQWPPLASDSVGCHQPFIGVVHSSLGRDGMSDRSEAGEISGGTCGVSESVGRRRSMWTEDSEGEEDDNAEHLKKAQFRIFQQNKVLVVVSLYGRHHEDPDGQRVLCASVGSTVQVGLDFTTADATTLEVHAFLIRKEIPLLHHDTRKSQVTEVTITAHSESVGSQSVCWFELFIPHNQCPSFDTDIVKVRYSLLFRFFTPVDEDKQPSRIPQGGRVKKSRIRDFEWRGHIRITPPHSDHSDTHLTSLTSSASHSHHSSTLYSLSGSSCLIGEGLTRMHRHMLV